MRLTLLAATERERKKGGASVHVTRARTHRISTPPYLSPSFPRRPSFSPSKRQRLLAKSADNKAKNDAERYNYDKQYATNLAIIKGTGQGFRTSVFSHTCIHHSTFFQSLDTPPFVSIPSHPTPLPYLPSPSSLPPSAEAIAAPY